MTINASTTLAAIATRRSRLSVRIVMVSIRPAHLPVILLGAVRDDLGPGGKAELKHAPKIGVLVIFRESGNLYRGSELTPRAGERQSIITG